MNSLVLGSKGLIGSYLVSYLQCAGQEVSEIDIKSGKDQDLRFWDSPSLIEDKFRKADFVYFLAFDVGGSKYLSSIKNNFQYIRDNDSIMYNTFCALSNLHKPFIFVSSQLSNLLSSTYGNLKLLGEKYTNSLGGMTAKLWNVYGKQSGSEDRFYVITDFINSAIKTHIISMKTDGEEKRQFLYAGDCAKALYTMANNYQNREYDISSFEWTSVIDLARIIASKTQSAIVISPNKDVIGRAKLEEPNKDILSLWKPETTLERGIDELISYYKYESI